MKVPAFDSIFERVSSAPFSVPESEALAELWAHGEDGWLREDERFRPTPWGRWIPAERYLVNDLIARALREGASELSLAGQLETVSKAVGVATAFCPADPRLRLDGDRVRLAPSELTGDPLIEDEVGPLLQFVTHLPVFTLEVAAASEPAGEWGPAAAPQPVEPVGWLRVEPPGRPLNRRMFVARVTGESMDGGGRPIGDRDWVIFEYSFHEGVAYDTGADRPIVLVRGDFHDPETGTYAVKRWDRSAPEVRLISANPDKERFPDIVVPLDDADHLRVVATLTKVLTHSDFARRPKPQRKPGRRVVEGSAGLAEQGDRLGRRLDAFFEGRPAPEEGGTEANGEGGWRARLVCLGLDAGGLHLEVGPLAGLPPFVKKLRAVGADDRDGVILAANARQRATLVSMAPGSGPWRWEAVDFEDEEDLGVERLAAEALPHDAVTVFRVDADGVGRRQSGRVLALGQAYRLLLPAGLHDGDLGESLADGWRLWSVDLTVPPDATERAALQGLGLALGEPWPRLEWALHPPAAWAATPRGDEFPVFEVGSDVVVWVRGLAGDEPVHLFLRGPSGVERMALTEGQDAMVSLGDLGEGRWACAVVHPRTEVQTTILLFEVSSTAGRTVDAAWNARVEQTPEGTPDLATLLVSAPPGWPVTLSWRVLSDVPLATVHADADGCVDLTGALAKLEERIRSARVGDLVVDLAELGLELVPYDCRPTVEEVGDALVPLWSQREALVRSRRGAWLTLVPLWFTPVCAFLGYALDELPSAADDDLAAWRLVVDERRAGVIHRSTARVLVLADDLDAALTLGIHAVDRACSAAGVREAIVTDGVRWTTHRRGNRLRQPAWDFGEALAGAPFEAMLAALAEGLG